MLARLLRLTVVGVLSLGAVGVGASPAAATFPGRNGRILVEGPLQRSPHERPPRVWTIRADGGDPWLLRSLHEPAVWSPDGRRLLFTGPCRAKTACCSNEGEPGPNELDTLDQDGHALRRIRFRTPRRWGCGPVDASWSPHATRLIYTRVEPVEAGDTAIFTSYPNGRRQRLLAHQYNGYAFAPPSYFGDARFSPDGRQIAFDANYGLYLMNLDGTGARPLIDCREALTPSQPRCLVDWLDWAPDSRSLVVGIHSEPTGPNQIVVINRDGSGMRVVRDGIRPFWSPDGRKIASILETTVGSGDLQISNADGTGVRTVRRHVSYADWQPLPRRSR